MADAPEFEVTWWNLERTTPNITQWRIQSSFLTSSDAFSFTVLDPDPKNLSGFELQPVSLYLGGNLQMNGRV